jgi:hypothetical protein
VRLALVWEPLHTLVVISAFVITGMAFTNGTGSTEWFTIAFLAAMIAHCTLVAARCQAVNYLRSKAT